MCHTWNAFSSCKVSIGLSTFNFLKQVVGTQTPRRKVAVPPGGLATNYTSRRGDSFPHWRERATETCERQKERARRNNELLQTLSVPAGGQRPLGGVAGKKQARGSRLVDSLFCTVTQGSSCWTSSGPAPGLVPQGGASSRVPTEDLKPDRWLSSSTGTLFPAAGSYLILQTSNLQLYLITDFPLYYLESLTNWSSNAFIFNSPLLISKMCTTDMKKITRKLSIISKNSNLVELKDLPLDGCDRWQRNFIVILLG